MRRCFPWMLAVVPPIFLLGMFLRFTVDFPLMDQWEFPLLLEKVSLGTWSIADFWAQHNEHRILFPRILMLGMATLSGWDIRWELAANFLLALLFFGLVCLYLRRVTLHSPMRSTVWVWPLLSLIVFSVAQWENWIYGWQLQAWMNAVAVLGAILLLTRTVLTPVGFFIALALALVASGSFANGLLLWPIGVILLLLQRRVPMLLGWTLMGIFMGWCYFHHYETPVHHPTPGAGLRSPLTFLQYSFVYLGQPVVGWSVGWAGFAGFVIALPMVVLIWRGRIYPQAILPSLGLVCFAVGSAMITASGRAGIGVEQALSPRYLTFANFYWIALVALLLTTHSRYRRSMLYGLLGALIAVNAMHGAYRWTERYNVFMQARPALMRGEDNGYLHFVYPDVETLLDRRLLLIHGHWSVFREE